MDFNSILEALSNGELTLNAEELTNLVVQASTKDEHINCDTLKDVISGINSVKKTAKDDFEQVKKDMATADKAKLAAIAQEYLATLNIGDAITWIANDEVQHGTVGEQKKGAKTAHLILDEIPANSKAKEPKADRYVKFEKIQVPADFVSAKATEEVA